MTGMDDLDSWVPPEEVAAIEVHDASNAPPQFASGGCGSVVIWTGPAVQDAAKP